MNIQERTQLKKDLKLLHDPTSLCFNDNWYAESLKRKYHMSLDEMMQVSKDGIVLRDKEKIELDWSDCMLTKEKINPNERMWRVYKKGWHVVSTVIDTYALQIFLNCVREVRN